MRGIRAKPTVRTKFRCLPVMFSCALCYNGAGYDRKLTSMELPFNSESSFLFKIAIVNFLLLCIGQFFILSLLGYKIYNRCKELGYNMKSRPYFAILNVSGLWREAREFNKRRDDADIAKYLRLYKFFWGYILASFLLIVLAAVLRPNG